jgi:adenosine deaminase
MNLSKADLALFQKNAVEISWAEKATKEKLLKEIDEYVAAN